MYDHFTTVAAAKKAYRRARSVKHFILTGKKQPCCAGCGRPVNDFTATDEKGELLHPEGFQGNRCVYYPGDKMVVARHYVCSWTNLLDKTIKAHMS